MVKSERDEQHRLLLKRNSGKPELINVQQEYNVGTYHASNTSSLQMPELEGTAGVNSLQHHSYNPRGHQTQQPYATDLDASKQSQDVNAVSFRGNYHPHDDFRHNQF